MKPQAKNERRDRREGEERAPPVSVGRRHCRPLRAPQRNVATRSRRKSGPSNVAVDRDGRRAVAGLAMTGSRRGFRRD